MIQHPIDPVYNHDSRILILGSFPSVKSRETAFFYAHPQNRFWKVLSAVLNLDLPASTNEKRAFLLRNHIALWDVIASCEVTGSSDSSIRNVTANDISVILNYADIRRIYVNGKTAEKYYNRYVKKALGIDAVCLPSTSPANAAYSLSRLVEAWQCIRLDIFDAQ